MITLKIDTSEFNRAMNELTKVSPLLDHKILFNTAKGLVLNLVRFTFLFKGLKKKRSSRGNAGSWDDDLEKFIERHAKGRARLGWWRAWKHLRIGGAPKIGNGPMKDRGEGGIIDKSRKLIFPHITVFNEVPYIDASDEKKRTLSKAVAFQTRFLIRAVDRGYTRMLKGKSG